MTTIEQIRAELAEPLDGATSIGGCQECGLSIRNAQQVAALLDVAEAAERWDDLNRTCADAAPILRAEDEVHASLDRLKAL